MKTVWRLCLAIVLAPVLAFAAGSDDFNDNSKDTSKWGNDVLTGGFGVLTEQNQRLEFTVSNPLTDGDTLRPWILERFPVDADWTVQVDVHNSTGPFGFGSVNSAGFTVFHPTQNTSELFLEFYAVSGGIGSFVELTKNDSTVDIQDSNTGNSSLTGAVRMEYSGATMVASCFYDIDVSDGYQWTPFANYGLGGSGGTTANTDWNLKSGQQFSVWVYGFAEFMTVSSGQLYLDNFVETGGAPPTGGPAPVPTGNFSFGFPTNNPLLTAIAFIGGSCSGIMPHVERPYTLDVAQDETGKLMAIGTVDGVTDSTGNPQMSSDIGGIKTVDGKPTVQSKGAFDFMVDGQTGSSKGKVSAPLEIEDIGGGTNGLIGTTTGSTTALGVPMTFKSTPIAVPEMPDMPFGFRKDWILDLDIHETVLKGKDVIVASGLLTLPNGDMIQFPEKKVKYSEKSGYKLSFKKGMNISMNPATLDKKTKINIKGLTFVQQGDDWEPTGGAIKYQFLGQKGAADLLDFVMP